MLFRSIKFQVTAALIAQVVVLLFVTFSTLYLLKLRQHDYLILNLSGQLRIIALTLSKQSENYVNNAPRNYEAYNRDLGLYKTDLNTQLEDFNVIITALKDRNISSKLSSYFYEGTTSPASLDEQVHCKWDQRSRQQLSTTIEKWQTFKHGVTQALGDNLSEPRLEYAAKYIATNSETLISSTSKLSSTFRIMMEDKLSQIDMLHNLAIFVILIISMAIIILLYFRIFRPIDTTVKGFNRVANGELDFQVKVDVQNEIGVMTSAFNRLTTRIHSIFQLTEGINQANDLDDTLKFLLNKYSAFLAIDWLCFAEHEAQHDYFQVSRIHCKSKLIIKEQSQFTFDNSFYQYTVDRKLPISIQYNNTDLPFIQNDKFISILIKNNYKSILMIPLSYNNKEGQNNTSALIFATTQEGSYNNDLQEFLKNIAPQISHAVNKTLGMESLIISAVEGLAKLAESRDPETGDHLFRMSHYSAIVAEQLSRTSFYSSIINPAYIRAILRFAPMHDIGKVGIGDYILLKPGALTEEETLTMQRHPVIGAEVLRRCEKQMHSFGNEIFKIGIEIAEGHHEKYDGSGYPNQISGDNIPLSARIVAVADVFDALTSKRPYKDAWSVDKALAVMNTDSGSHFDPDVMLALEKSMPSILEIYEKHKHI